MRTSNPEISKAYLESSQVSKTETHYRFTSTMCTWDILDVLETYS